MKALLTAAFLLLTAGLQAGVSTKLKVFVPVLPYETLFERIGGDWIEVRAIVQEGGDCHNYSPTPRQVADIARSNLLVSGGLSFESNFYVAVGDGENGPKEFDLLEGLELLEGTCSECASASAEGREAPAHQHEHEEKDATSGSRRRCCGFPAVTWPPRDFPGRCSPHSIDWLPRRASRFRPPCSMVMKW